MDAAEVDLFPHSQAPIFPCQIQINALPATTCSTSAYVSDTEDKDSGDDAMELDVSAPDPAAIKLQAEMYARFQAWALRNYGDSGKTKTVTRRKYERIRRILTGEEPPTSDNSKFRFWVKGKGFRLGPAAAASVAGYGGDSSAQYVLYVPCREKGGSGVDFPSEREYKRVAVVEDFFNIIYGVHVEMDGRGGKHAGQKRTYKAIAEMYSFLPREAVTRFLMSCADCQKRMHLTTNENNNIHNRSRVASHDDEEIEEDEDSRVTSTESEAAVHTAPVIDFTLPITTAYLSQMKKSNDFDDKEAITYADNNEDSMSSVESALSASQVTSPAPADVIKSLQRDFTEGSLKSTSPPDVNLTTKHISSGSASSSPLAVAIMASNGSLNNGPLGNGILGNSAEDMKPLMIVTESKSHNDRKRRASDDSLDSSTKASEGGVDDLKDDDNDEDDDDDEKLQSQDVDPERLKAFNMFVRLFVDENLDRSIPISKQPKDKIQAILEACDRQFPEFHDRSRKRIRTYLKSCRRLRRSKDGNGYEMMRPTPPHLTSAAAETILAQACENEGSNAKRMRMGLEPLPALAMQSGPSPLQTCQRSNAPSPSISSALSNSPAPTALHALTSGFQPSMDVKNNECIKPNHTPSIGFRHPHELPSPFFAANGNGLFRPSIGSAYQPPAHQHSRGLTQSPHLPTTIQNGPTDLSMKKSSSSSSSSNKTQQLNPAEVATIKQLIAGYRESAAFLYRSADELEQLLLHQN